MRQSGVLLHITSLPSRGGIGTLGQAAYDFVDFVKDAGMSIWQMLPIGPTGYAESPYQSTSTFAGNPLMIDFDMLEAEGILPAGSYEPLDSLPNVDFVGTVPFEKTQSYFNRAKLHLSTSAVEGFPNTFLQAWFAKSPIVSVTFPCDGILQKYNIGVLSGTTAQTAKDIDSLLRDETRRQLLGQNGYDYVLKHHSPENILSILEKMISESDKDKTAKA